VVYASGAREYIIILEYAELADLAILKYMCSLHSHVAYPSNRTEEPFHMNSIQIVRGILASDTKYSKHNNLGAWVTDDEKNSILGTFNSAVEITQRWREDRKTT
jgi:hypothetical protein